MAWTKVATLEELPPGALIEVESGEHIIALCNVDGNVRALDGLCPHHGGPLGHGVLTGGVVTCPWHMWDFDTGTGACGLNARITVDRYPVRVEGAEILVNIA
jgi:nitrite reductase (NADH) small subunit